MIKFFRRFFKKKEPALVYTWNGLNPELLERTGEQEMNTGF